MGFSPTLGPHKFKSIGGSSHSVSLCLCVPQIVFPLCHSFVWSEHEKNSRENAIPLGLAEFGVSLEKLCVVLCVCG